MKYRIKGRIKKIVYNDNTTYTHATLAVIEQEPRYNGSKFAEVKIRSMVDQKVYEGDVVDFTGDMTTTSYGRTIKNVENLRVILPQEERDICRYFSSRALRIKKSVIMHCIGYYGMDFMTQISRNPALLDNDRMIPPATRKKIVDACVAEKEYPMMVAYLKSCGVNTKYALKLKAAYPDDALNILRTNPYVLRGLTFGDCTFYECDKIAFKCALLYDSNVRAKALVKEGMAYTIEQECSTYTDRKSLIDRCMIIQQKSIYADNGELIQQAQIAMQIDDFVKYGDFVDVSGCLYRKSMHEIENGINNFVMAKIGQAGIVTNEKAVAIVNAMNTNCDSVQKGAVVNALTHGISILTGGPGTGKTTTINAIISAIKTASPKARIRLLAPTGVSARRMEANTSLTAETIHKSCRIIRDARMDENFKLEADVVIVDEFSMTDIFTFYNLIRSLEDDAKMVIVGDHDQLPSVSCGALMRDFVQSGIIPCTILMHVYRQVDGTIISTIAKSFRDRETINENDMNHHGFFFLRREPWQAYQTLAASIDKLLRGGRTFSDIMILSPRRIGVHGTDDLNRCIQSRYNKESDYVEHGETRFKKGDLVMCNMNDYDRDVMNGERGVVMAASMATGKVVVDFGNGRLVEYERGSLDLIELAYAITIHKSQGTECKNVICLCTDEFQYVYNNLFYTAMTRAKEQCIFIGSVKKFNDSEYQSMPERRSNILKGKVCNA